MHNELGLKSKHPVNITKYSHEDFLRYLVLTQYDQAMALATQQATEKNEVEMKKLASTTQPMQLLLGE